MKIITRTPESPLPLALAVQYACDSAPGAAAFPARPQLRRWVRAAQDMPLSVTLRFVDTGEGHTLNRDYRGKNAPTNVLTFVYGSPPGGQGVSGDVVLCWPVVCEEAAAQGKPVMAHLAHLVVHGMLHLQGYDHEAGPDEAARMEARERTILARFGIPDPYESAEEMRETDAVESTVPTIDSMPPVR